MTDTPRGAAAKQLESDVAAAVERIDRVGLKLSGPGEFWGQSACLEQFTATMLPEGTVSRTQATTRHSEHTAAAAAVAARQVIVTSSG
jgi:hypothetical protein